MTHGQVRIPVLNCCFTLSGGVKHVLFFTLLRTFYLSVVGVFVPVFVYSNFGLQVMIIFLFLYYGLFYIPSVYLVRYVIEKKTLEFAQALSIVFAVAQVISLTLCYEPWILVIPAILGSLSMTFYWIPKHLIFGIYGNRKQMTEQYAFVTSLSCLISILGPISVSMFIFFLGYHVVFLILSVLLVFLSLFSVKYLKRKRKVALPKRRTIRKFYPFFAMEGIWNGIYPVATVLIYLFTENIVLFGGVTSLMALFAIVTTLLISKRVDKKHDYALGALGILLRANIFTMLFLLYNTEAALFSMILFGLVGPLVDTPFYGFLYNLVKKYGPGIVYSRAILLSSFRAVTLLMFLFVGIRVMLGFATMFVALFGVIYYLLSIEEELSHVKKWFRK